MKDSPAIFIKWLLLILTSIIYIGCTEKTKDNVKMYKVVPLKTPPFDTKKYNLVDTSKTYTELRIRAYQTKNTNECMQIFDYLLTYNPREADVDEFFKHFDASEKKDLRNSREFALINLAIKQNTYTRIKEYCINYMIYYQISQTHLDSVLLWMDSLRIIYPGSEFFIQERYDLVSNVATSVARINADKRLSKPERLWLLGYSYWRLVSAEFKSSFYPFLAKTRIYFDSLKNQYPKSPFVANAIFIENIDLSDEGDDIDTLFNSANVNKLMALLKKYPGTTARDEILLRYASYHYSKALWLARKNQDSALYYWEKADSIISLIDSSKLFLNYSPLRYHNLITEVNRKQKGKRDVLN